MTPISPTADTTPTLATTHGGYQVPVRPLPPLLPVIPTPLRDGHFDPASFDRFLEHLEGQVDGFVLLGSTGEAPSMPVAMRRTIAEQAMRLVNGAYTVVVGVTSAAQADAVELTRHAAGLGAAGVLCAAPFYFAAGTGGVLGLLAGVDDALSEVGSGTELVFYDNPDATKVRVSADEVVAWSRALQHLHHVKLTEHDLSKIAVWQSAGLRVFAGDDPIAFRFLRAGVDGAMMIAPAVFPAVFRRVWELSQVGDWDAALAEFARIATFSHVFGVGDEIATTKALFADLGIYDSAEVLAPLQPATPERTALLRTAYRLGAGSPVLARTR